MKNITLNTTKKSNNRILIAILLLCIIFSSSAQVRSNQALTSGVPDENMFLDASSNFDISANGSPSIGKGLSFPSTNLTQFQFIISDSWFSYPTALDGMVVYNVATGSTMATTPFGGIGQPLKADNGLITTVSPGFYYFYNPIRLDGNGDPLPADTVEFGKWLPLGTGGSGVVTVPVKSYNNLTETSTGISIDGKTVYALTGTFTADTAPTVLVPNPTYVSTAVVSITKPTGFTGYFKMTTYTTDLLGVKKTFRSDVSSLTVDPLDATKLILVTGNGLFSEVYPGGTYTYILEFFKA